MGYTDAKGRPELVMNPAITRGEAGYRIEAPAPARRVQRIALYEHDGDGVYLQADDGPVWALIGPNLGHTFDFDAPEWLRGGWSPAEDYLGAEWEQRSGRTRGLTLVAAWTRQHRLGIVVNLPGRAAALYLGVPSIEDASADDDE